MITLSQQAAGLIKYTLVYTGEKEINARGQEVDAQRRLNGEDSAQRRFFITKVDPIIEEKQTRINNITTEAKKVLETAKEDWKKANVKIDKEEDKAYETRMNIALTADKELNEKIKAFNESISLINKETVEVELTDKTIAVVKKYVKEFGDKAGWLTADEEFVQEINEALK